jgi:antirestriction protein ArdC
MEELAMAETKRDLRQEVTDQIIRALEQGTAPWQKPWQAGALELPFNPVSGKPYRGGNAVQLMVVASSKGYDDPRWLTYRQAQETVSHCTVCESRSRNFQDRTSPPPACRTEVRAGSTSQ